MSGIQQGRAINALSMLLALILAITALGLSPGRSAAIAGTVAALFAVTAWLLRGVDMLGAIAGGAIAFVFYAKGGWRIFVILVCVYVITLAATKFSASRNPSLITAPRGRTAVQVLANLLVPACLLLVTSRMNLLIACAALTELAADTVSSELGETFRGHTYLITTWRGVPCGTNGGLSLTGTLWGFAASTLVASGAFFLDVKGALWIPQVAGFAGMIVDSLLGATLENRRCLNNEAVNLLGTGSAAGIAWVLIRWNG